MAFSLVKALAARAPRLLFSWELPVALEVKTRGCVCTCVCVFLWFEVLGMLFLCVLMYVFFCGLMCSCVFFVILCVMYVLCDVASVVGMFLCCVVCCFFCRFLRVSGVGGGVGDRARG